MSATPDVVVFSTEGCPHCAKAKGILAKLELEFLELNLSDYPELRKPMVKLAASLTVPQIFFNGEHIGGASDLEQIYESGELLKRLADARAGPELDAETAALLAKPGGPPKPAPKPSPRPEESYEGPKKTMSAIDMVMLIGENLPRVFDGSQLSECIAKAVGFASAGSVSAVALAQRVAENGIVSLSAKWRRSKAHGEKYVQQKPADFEKSLFTLVSNRLPAALNLFRRWNDRVDPANLVALSLKNSLNSIISRHRDGQGLVDYVGVGKDQDFPAFEEATAELQGIKLSGLDPDTRLAFVINVYNLLTLHAFVRLGVPRSDVQRLDFFDNHGYVIGDEFWTFNELENGVLRMNKAPPFHLAKPISKGDTARLKALMPTLYPQIHASLNCGAKSCPPIKSFSIEAVHEEMDLATQAFFEDAANCSVDEASRIVTLTQIVKWYSSDFGSSQKLVLETVRKWLSGEKARAMDALLGDDKPITVRYSHYDWTTDSSRSKPFKRSKSLVGIVAGLCSVL